MTRTFGSMAAGVLLFLAPAPVCAQGAATGGFSADLVRAVSQVETKIVGLAEALSAAQYDWRPGEGVRSVGEVLLHVAADNYFLPGAIGVPAPEATNITAEYATVQAYENQKLDREATIAEVKASFDHLKRALSDVPEARMDETLSLFGQEFTVRSFMLLTTTHLHEHLGQLIAYARSNGVTPPWSR
jgi:uncharacterized damage-inducible protein DinB